MWQQITPNQRRDFSWYLAGSRVVLQCYVLSAIQFESNLACCRRRLCRGSDHPVVVVIKAAIWVVSMKTKRHRLSLGFHGVLEPDDVQWCSTVVGDRQSRVSADMTVSLSAVR